MNQKLTVNKGYWLGKNSDIQFYKTKKAFYGTHLIKVKLDLTGASIRYYEHDYKTRARATDPSYDEFRVFLNRQIVRFGWQQITHIVDERYIHTTSPDTDRVYDAKALYALYWLLKEKPDGIRFAREGNVLHIYANDIGQIEPVLNELHIDYNKIVSITFPDSQDVDDLLAGNEFNVKAEHYKYKVFLRPPKSEKGIPDLARYVDNMKGLGEVEMPPHCKAAITQPVTKWTWAHWHRSYLYVLDDNTLLLVKMLAGEFFSDAVELIMPRDENDK